MLVPRKALKLGDAQPRPVPRRGAGDVRLRRDDDRLRPRLRPRAEARRQAVHHPRPRLPRRPTPSSTARRCRPASRLAINPHVLHQQGHPGRPRAAGRRSGSTPAVFDSPDRPAWDREFLVVEETLPAGTTLIEGSVQSDAGQLDAGRRRAHVLLRPRARTRARSTTTSPATCPAEYRALPTKIRAAYDPGVDPPRPGRRRSRSSPPASRRPTPTGPRPTSCYARGKALFQARPAPPRPPSRSRSSSAATRLRDDVAQDAARMLLTIHIKDYQPRKVVQDFEILTREGPRAGHPVRRGPGRRPGLPRHRRARAGLPGLPGDRRGELPRGRPGRRGPPPARQDARRRSPTCSTSGASRPTRRRSRATSSASRRSSPAPPTRANTDPALRRELADAGVTRSELILQAIRMIQVVLSQSPRNPLADEASLALLGVLPRAGGLRLGRQARPEVRQALPEEHVPRQLPVQRGPGPVLARQVRPGHRGRRGDRQGHLQGRQRRRPAQPEQVAGDLHPRPDLRRPPQPGQGRRILQAGRRPVRRRRRRRQGPDPQGPEAARGLDRPARRDGRPPGRRSAAIDAEPPSRGRSSLDYRNIAEVDVKVYPVDLMRLYLTRRNLDGIAGIDLAGITPTGRGDGQARRRAPTSPTRSRRSTCPLTKEGAYLVMARGENLYASGIVLVTPLELEVLEEADAGPGPRGGPRRQDQGPRCPRCRSR